MVEVILVLVEPLVEEEAMVAEVVMEVDTVHLEVMVVVLVVVIEETMVMVDQDMETKVVDTVVEEEDMVAIMMDEENLVVVAMVVGSIIKLGNSNKNMDPCRRAVLVEDTQAVPVVMITVSLVAETSAISRKGSSS